MQKGLEYQEINIQKTPEAVDELMALGARATPVLVIGDEVIVGFQPEAMDRAVASK